MKKKKAIKFFQLYDSLSAPEKEQFHNFLKLTFIPKIRVSKTIINHLKSDTDLLNFINSKFSQRSIWNICSELTKALEQFLAVEELLSDNKKITELVRKQMSKRNLDKLLEHEYKNAINKLLNSKIHADTFKEIAEISGEYLKLSVKTGSLMLQTEIFRINNNFIALNFLFVMITEMINNVLADYTGVKSEVVIMEETFSMFDFEVILKSIKRQFPDFYPVFQFYYDAYILISKRGNFELYKKVKRNFFNLIGKFTEEYSVEIFRILTECLFSLREISMNDIDKELFELFRKKFDAGIIGDLKENRIGNTHFRDIVKIALCVGEIKWAENFVEKFSAHLPENQRSNDVNTSKALIMFKKQEYEKAIEYAGEISRSYYIHYNDFFRISIKSNYELLNFNECESLLEKYRDYLRRTGNLPQGYVAGSMRFIRNVKDLINYKFKLRLKYLDRIGMEVLKKSIVSENKWVEEKMNEFLKKKVTREVI
ncbi:MAG: hypothetical protein ABI840_12900 [bacterium]